MFCHKFYFVHPSLLYYMLLAQRCRSDLFLIVPRECQQRLHRPFWSSSRGVKLFDGYLGYFYMKAHAASGHEYAVYPDHSPDVTPLSQDPFGVESSSRFLLVFYVLHFVKVYEELSRLAVERNLCVKCWRMVRNVGLLSVPDLLFDIRQFPIFLRSEGSRSYLPNFSLFERQCCLHFSTTSLNALTKFFWCSVGTSSHDWSLLSRTIGNL